MAALLNSLFVGLLLVFSTSAVRAKSYPVRTIRLVVPWPAGGIVDALGRIIGKKMSDNLGQPVVVENRVGAASAIGADNVAKAAPDGYTLLVATSGHAINVGLSKNLPYDALNDFTAIRLIATAPSVLVVHPELPVKTTGQLIALAKDRPGKLTYASAGNGSFAHILAELFKQAASIEVLHVPYRGQPQAVTDLLAGRVDMLFATMTVAVPQIEAGKLTALGVTAKDRVSALPTTPTLGEAGIPGFEGGQWLGILGPKGMSDELIQTLGKEIDKVLKDPEVRAAIEVQGMYILNEEAATFRTMLDNDIKRWVKLIAETGIAAN